MTSASPFLLRLSRYPRKHRYDKCFSVLTKQCEFRTRLLCHFVPNHDEKEANCHNQAAHYYSSLTFVSSPLSGTSRPNVSHHQTQRAMHTHSISFLGHTPNFRLMSTTANHGDECNNKHHLKMSGPPKDSLQEPNRKERAKKLGQTGARKARKGAGKAKDLLKKYGGYFVGTYFVIYSITLSSFYAALDSGLIDPISITNFWGGELGDGEEEVDAVKMVANLLEKWEWTRQYSEHVEKNPQLTTLGIAWLGVKIVEPLRIGLAVYTTPKVAKFFGKEVVEEDEDEDDRKENDTGGKSAQ